jgi:pSer/pThr/pTyr-binding forkhead associated (FHA) protein
MRVCPSCGSNSLEGVLYCEECGQPLYGENVPSTVSTLRLQTGVISGEGKYAFGSVQYTPTATVTLHMRDSNQTVELRPQEETILGRQDNSNRSVPMLDLTPYGAYEKGVSRIHAAIRRTEETLNLVDLGSVNGTHLNGQRLNPNQPRILRDGDEIRLGKLVCHLYFK